MSEPQIPPTLSDFISRYIHSVEHLEILLLVNRDPNQQWTVNRVYDEILSTPHSVARRLEDLAGHGLIRRVAEPVEYYQACTDETLMPQISQLADSYRRTPVRVVEEIYRRKSTAAQSFADAFRIKKPGQP